MSKFKIRLGQIKKIYFGGVSVKFNNADQMISLAIFCFALSGCNAPRSESVALFSIPVTGQLSNGVAAGGQATAFSTGFGEFWVKIPGGARCSGTYNVRDPSPTLVVPVACTDGHTGEAVITRTPDLMSGSALVSLSGGLTGQFVFGNITFSQTFGNGGVAKIR